jgi:short-subunit dehydrogenase
MKKRKNGYILNVASVAGFFPGPFMSVYYATKAYVVSFSLALSHELKPYNIVVNSLCPGPTASNFAENAGMGNALLFKLMPLPSSKDVAEYGYNQLKNRNIISVHGIHNKLNVFISRFITRKLMLNIIAKIQKNR